MTDKPILFSGPMVRALRDNRKSQTRRVVVPQPPKGLSIGSISMDGVVCEWVLVDEDGDLVDYKCPQPRYAVGDRLWVRETWALCPCSGGVAGQGMAGCSGVIYRADGERPPGTGGPWRPSIFMPRWASRLTLEVTEVRCHRLQDISEADAIAEGCSSLDVINAVSPHYEAGEYYTGANCYRAVFRDLWNFINGKTHPWAENPFVWAYSFRRLP